MRTVETAEGSVFIGGLQERAARAVPAVVVDDLDGWWLCYADNDATWWAGATLPHGDRGPLALPCRIRSAEEFYAAHDAPARFEVSPAAPAELDDALADRGYRLESPMSLQSAPTSHVIERLPTAGPRIRIDDQPSDEWFETWLAVHGFGSRAGPEREMLGRVERPSAYASVVTEAGAVAVGRAVAEAGWAGVFGMATLPEARRRGAGRAVLAALTRWAADHDAGHMYLQVECGNAGARRLYERAGFIEQYRYHYRTGGHVP